MPVGAPIAGAVVGRLLGAAVVTGVDGDRRRETREGESHEKHERHEERAQQPSFCTWLGVPLQLGAPASTRERSSPPTRRG